MVLALRKFNRPGQHCEENMTKHKRKNAAGVAVVELAVLLPFLAFITVIAIDWARIFHFTLTLNACARNGALYASDSVLAKQSPYADVSGAALAEAPNLNPRPTVAATYGEEGGFAVVDVRVSMPFNTITNFPGVPASQIIAHTVRMRMAPIATR